MMEREMDERKRTILVAIDGSDNSDRALVEAKSYAQAMEAELTILTVVGKEVSHHYHTAGKVKAHHLEKKEKDAQELLNDAKEYFKDHKLAVHGLLKKGDPANQILKEIESGDYNLVIMGNRGLGAFSRNFLGSVSNKVLNHSDTSVLVVR